MTHHAATTKPSSPRFRFFGETLAELKKAVWLTRRQVIYLSVLVLIITGVAGLTLGAIDYSFSRLIEGLFLGG